MTFKYSAALSFAVLISTVQGGVLVPQAPTSDHFFNFATELQPVGTNETIGDLNVTTYVSLPPEGTYDNETAVVLLTDIYGLAKTDNLLLTDQWAQAGFPTFTPDYLLGDPVPQDGSGNTTEWFLRHGEDATTPPLLSVIDALKAQGIKKIGVTGYCFGGLYVFRLAQNNTVQVTTTAHPSRLVIPDDAELVLSQSQVPLQIHSAEKDSGLTPALAEQVDEVLVDYESGYNRTAWAGVGHGFAVSANASDPVAVAAKEGAFQSALAWVKTHLDEY